MQQTWSEANVIRTSGGQFDGHIRTGALADGQVLNEAAFAGTGHAATRVTDEQYAEVTAHIDRDNDDWAEYYAGTERKHFDDDAPGSKFTGHDVSCLEDVLSLAILQRGNLDGDDRHEFIRDGAAPNAFSPHFRYIKVRTAGVLGVKDTSLLPGDQLVSIERTKPGVPCSVVVDIDERDATDTAAIVIASDKDTGLPRLITAFPGLVTKAPKSDELDALEGQQVTVAEVRRILGGDIHANARLRTAVAL